MDSPANITFRHLEPTAALREDIENRIAVLEQFYPNITSCDVVITGPTQKHETGQEFQVQVTVQVPGPKNITVADKLGRSAATADLNLLVHQVFEAVDRQLREHARVMSGLEVKHHADVLHGTIDRLFEGEGYGFIKSDDGNEVYFERDNLTKGDWDKLRVDMRVRFREGMGDKGPYAMKVSVSS